MPDRSGREVLEEWRGLMESAVSSAASAAGRPDLPRELVGAMQNQMSLMQRVVDRERLQGSELAARILAPLDAVFDLLEEGGATLRREAEALETAGRALQETAGLMKRQAELFEQTIGVLREPAEFAKTAVGLDRRSRKSRTGESAQPSSAPRPERTKATRQGAAAKRSGSTAKRSSSVTKRQGEPTKRQGAGTKPRSAAAKRQAPGAKRQAPRAKR